MAHKYDKRYCYNCAYWVDTCHKAKVACHRAMRRIDKIELTKNQENYSDNKYVTTQYMWWYDIHPWW